MTRVLSPRLGVYARLLCIGGAAGSLASGFNMVGLGTDDTAVIRYDVSGGGAPGDDDAYSQSGPSQDRVSAAEKGSLVFFSKVEIRGDAMGALVQDAFLSLTNDSPKDVLINGDPPLNTGPRRAKNARQP